MKVPPIQKHPKTIRFFPEIPGYPRSAARRAFLGLPGLQQLGLGLSADAIGLEHLMDFAPDLQHGVLPGVVIP